MLENTRMRALPVLNRAVDLAPASQACCGACRTCVSTNIVSALAAGAMLAAAPVVRLGKRLRRS